MTLSQFWKKIYSNPRRIARRRRWGIPAMVAFRDAMAKAGIPWSPVYGTLLGAIREKGFIKHDDDIDTGVWTDSITGGLDNLHRCLKEAGFTYGHSFLVDGGAYAREETWKWHGLHVDIFFFDPIEGERCKGYMFYPFKGTANFRESKKLYGGLRVVEFEVPFSKETETVPFDGIEVPITKSAEGFVVARYGLDWRTPDPTFVYPRPGVSGNVEVPDKLAVKTVE